RAHASGPTLGSERNYEDTLVVALCRRWEGCLRATSLSTNQNRPRRRIEHKSSGGACVSSRAHFFARAGYQVSDKVPELRWPSTRSHIPSSSSVKSKSIL